MFKYITCFRIFISFSVSTDCAKMSCSGDIVQGEYSLFPDFNRTFIWDLKVVSTTAFQLDFPEPGMRQIPNKEICLDEHTYSVITYLRTGPATIGTFCKGGPVSTLLVRYKGRMFLQVPGDKKLDPVDFKFSTGPQTDSKTKVMSHKKKKKVLCDIFFSLFRGRHCQSQTAERGVGHKLYHSELSEGLSRQ